MESFWLIVKYLLLGILQGVTEPIPISSSGHVVIVQQLFDLKLEGMSFEVFVNTASLLAVLAIYRQDITRLAVSAWQFLFGGGPKKEEQRSDFMMVLYVILGTIPAGVLGVLFKDYIGERFKGIHFVGYSLVITAIALFIIRNIRGRKSDADLSWKDALIVGLGQAVALLPGISRSGATIVTAMLLGMKQETALRFSFLLYIPISLGGALLELPKLASIAWSPTLAIAYTAAFIASFVGTYYALRWFMNIMRHGKLVYFSVYCILLALFVLIFL